MVSVILVEPTVAGNVGGVARVLKNFGYDHLILVNPKCDYFSEEAKNRAKNAQTILKNALIIKNLKELDLDLLIGTTSKIGSDYNVQRSPLNPEQFADLIKKRKKVGVVFGREDRGLLNTELELCDWTVTIPTSKMYPALNLVTATGIILYHLFVEEKKENITSHITYASKKDREVLLHLIDKKLNTSPFSLSSKRDTQKKIWRRLIGKSFLTKREIFALCGFFKKVK